MKHHIISLIAIFILNTLSLATLAQSRDRQASDILEEVTAKTLAYESISLDFSYHMENPDANINEVTTGKALISGNKYRLDIAGQIIISDGETIWTIITDAEEVQINDAANGDNTFTPTQMLSTYSEEYKSKLLPRITSLHGKNVHAMELTPNERKSYDRVNLYIDSDTMNLYLIEIFEQSGSKYTYKITRFDTNIEPDKNTFMFSEEEFPGFYVIDMR
jgi:outer membrane lipoprotein carrier protein